MSLLWTLFTLQSFFIVSPLFHPSGLLSLKMIRTLARMKGLEWYAFIPQQSQLCARHALCHRMKSLSIFCLRTAFFFFAIYSDLVYALCFAKKHQCQTERINCRFPLLNTNKAKCSPPKMFAYIRNSYIEFEFALFCLEMRLDMSR